MACRLWCKATASAAAAPSIAPVCPVWTAAAAGGMLATAAVLPFTALVTLAGMPAAAWLVVSREGRETDGNKSQTRVFK